MNISWIFTLMSLVGNVFVIKKHVAGQIIWAVSNVCWAAYFFSIKEIASAVLFSVYLLLCIWGIISWRKEKPKDR